MHDLAEGPILGEVIPAIWLSTQGWFELHQLRWTSFATVAIQAAAAWWMLSGALDRKLGRVTVGFVVPSVGQAPLATLRESRSR